MCLLFLLLALVPRCGGQEEAPSSRPALPLPPGALLTETDGDFGGRLDYSLAGEPSSFNFATAENVRTRLITQLTTGTLLEFDPERLTVVPGIASHWQLSPDSRAVRLKLRRGLHFSDGHPMEMSDVTFTLDKLFEEGSETPLAATLRLDGEPLGYHVVDDDSLDIIFPRQFAAAEYVLSTVPVLPRHLLDHPVRKLEEFWTLDTDPAEMAGLGPFVIAEHHPGAETIFRYNPQYWKADAHSHRLPYVDEIVVHYIPRRDTQILRLEAGELDLLDYQVRPSDFERLKDTSFQLINAGASVQLKFLWFNQNPSAPGLSAAQLSWFSNLYFRRAVSTAISRQSIVDTVFRGQAEVAWGLVPSSLATWYVSDLPKYPYDPTRARELLAQGGFSWKEKDGRNQLVDGQSRPVHFEIFCRPDQQWSQIAAVLQQDLEKLGMDVSVRQEEFRALISRVMRSHDYDAALLGIEFPFEPVDHQNVILSSSSMHFWNPSQKSPATPWEAELDRLMIRQVTTLNLPERQRIYTQIQTLIAENVPLVPLVNQNILVIANPRVKGLRPVPLYPHTLWNAWALSL